MSKRPDNGLDEPEQDQPFQNAPDPRGGLVSNLISVSDGVLRPRMEHTLRVVDRIHGVRQLPAATVGFSSQIKQEGLFIPGVSGEASRIVISTRAYSPELTLLQEIGHFLDFDGLGIGHGYFSATAAGKTPGLSELSDAMRSVLRQAQQSRAFKDLLALSGRRFVRLEQSSGKRYNEPVPQSYVQYLLTVNEVFARAYAQWIVVNSGDAALNAQLDARRTRRISRIYFATQWDNRDFEAIAAALRA